MSLYTADHANPRGVGDARPTALQIIQDENLEGKLTGNGTDITGTTSRIGIETTRSLSIMGAILILTARDLKKAEIVLAGIVEPGRELLVQMNNASFPSLRTTVTTVLAKSNNQVNIVATMQV